MHGDIKPENVLVYRGESGKPQAKVIDFGYSCFGCKEENYVHLGFTAFWHAPEWHQSAFTIKEAKSMDLYSFGKLCAWILAAHSEPSSHFAARPQSYCFEAIEVLQGTYVNPSQGTSLKEFGQFKDTVRNFLSLTLTDCSRRASSIQPLLTYLDLAAHHLRT